MPAFYTNFEARPAHPQGRITGSTRIIDLTVDELTSLITTAVNSVERAETKDEWVKGLNGLAEILGCSKSEAQKIKASGRYRTAIKQTGRIIMINKTQLLNMLPNS